MFKESRNASWQLAKFLFAANAGAAAGMFVMVQNSPGDPYLIAAFFSFCFGVFAVGLAYFVGAWSFNRLAIAWEDDLLSVLRGEVSPSMANQQQWARVRGGWSKIIPFLGTLSFLALCGGGAVAIKPFLASSPPSPATSINTTVP